MPKLFENTTTFLRKKNQCKDLDTAFIWASSNGYIKIINDLLSLVINININDGIALKLAAVHEKYDAVNLLCSKGANVDLLKNDALIIKRLLWLNNRKILTLLGIQKPHKEKEVKNVSSN